VSETVLRKLGLGMEPVMVIYLALRRLVKKLGLGMVILTEYLYLVKM
jgi:hypothetical protein